MDISNIVNDRRSEHENEKFEKSRIERRKKSEKIITSKTMMK